MADNEEYRRKLERQISQARKNKKACKERIEEYEYLLRRLKSAKRSIVELKSNFKSNKKLDNELKKEKREWEGSTCKKFKTKMTNVVDANDSYYKGSIDHILDSLNNEITRIENKKYREYGLLGELSSWINSLSNKIENILN